MESLEIVGFTMMMVHGLQVMRIHSLQVGNISQMVNGFTLKTQSSHENWTFNFPSGSYYVDENAGMTSNNWSVPYQTEICPGLNLTVRLSLDGFYYSWQ